jgi:hypothetical protein
MERLTLRKRYRSIRETALTPSSRRLISAALQRVSLIRRWNRLHPGTFRQREIGKHATSTRVGSRQNQLGVALNTLDLADTEIAPNINFTIDSGTLMN